MIPRKQRITIMIVMFVFIFLIFLGILGILYLNTDMFKSKEKLFAKYLMQNFDSIEIIKNIDNSEIEQILENSKYTSEIEGKIEYTENIGTSDENKNNPINDVKIKINNNIDRIDNYSYRDVSIVTNDDKLAGLEYIKQNQTYGIRLNGIQQFVSTEDIQNDEILKQYRIEDMEKTLKMIDINSILNFSKEEKQSLVDTYLNIIKSNISKDKYYKQSNSLITVNNKDMQTNAYYVKMTIEEYNNLYIKILEQITTDEIILSKIDLIENELKEKYDYDEDLRELFINSINNKIEEIKNNNIGSDEIKITIYENKGKTVRTSIEKNTNKITIDFYDNSTLEIRNIKIGNNTNEQLIKIENTKTNAKSNIIVEIDNIKDNEKIKNIKLSYQQIFENNELDKDIELEISNERYDVILSIINNTQIVQEFTNEVTLDKDNIKLSDLNDNQIELVKEILNKNLQEQTVKLSSKVNLQRYIDMLKNLEIINQNVIKLPAEGEITDIERKRFNSQFEFFVSENLTNDNIKELINVVENNLENMKVLLKNGDIEDLDTEIIEDYRYNSEYKKEISEILLLIKEGATNDSKKEDTLNFFEKYNRDKYNVSIQYDDDGLARLIRIEIVEQ